MSETRDQQWDKAVGAALEELQKFMKLGNPQPRDYQRVKVAQGILSNWTRHEATESAKEQTRVVAARFMRNSQESAEYLRLAAPTLQIPSADGGKN